MARVATVQQRHRGCTNSKNNKNLFHVEFIGLHENIFAMQTKVQKKTDSKFVI